MSILAPKSYDGTDISQASANYRARFPRDGAALTPARQQQRVVRVAGFWPRALDPQPVERQFTLLVVVPLAPSDAALQAVKTLFSPAKGERTLVATDGTTDWQMACSVVAVDHVAGLLTVFRVTLQASYGFWKKTTDTTASVSISATTTATLNAPTVGNERTPAIIDATPTAVKGTGNDQRYRREVTFAWTAARGATNYPVTLQLDTATEVAAGRMQADGDDLRVIVDGREVDRWLGTMNAALTNVWIVLDFSPARSAALLAAITNVAPATGGSLTFQDGSALPSSGVLMIGTEAIAWTSKSADGDTLLNITRGVRVTNAANHALGDIGYLVEHQIDIVYGYTAATAPVTDDTRKPIIELGVADSNNGKWTFEQFATNTGTRPAEWVPTLLGANTGMVALRGGLGAAVNYLPVADGTENDFTPNTGTRWQAVDDPVGAPDNDTTYVASPTTGRVRQSFDVTVVKPPDGSMIALTMTAVVRSTSGDDVEYGPILFMGGVNYEVELYWGDGHPAAATPHPGAITTSYLTKTWPLPASPRTAISWTADEVAAIQEIGFIIWNLLSVAHRITSIYLSVRSVDENDTATAIGMFVAPNGSLQGHVNADAWALATPLGVTGQASIVADAHMGVDYGGIQRDAAVYGVDETGQTVPVWKSWNNASLGHLPDSDITITASPGGPLYTVLFWASTAASVTTAFAGFSVSKTVLLFDADAAPIVNVSATNDAYIHRWSLTDPGTGQTITVLFPSALNKKLTIDADAGAITYADAGYNPLPGLSLDAPRLPWLELVAGANALAWADSRNGSGALTLASRVRDRRS